MRAVRAAPAAASFYLETLGFETTYDSDWYISLRLVAFLAFDLSALGYFINQQVGAFTYNLVHNYAVPATLLSCGAALQLTGLSADWMLLLSCC